MPFDREPSRHNHVGHMVYTEFQAWCEGCGQRWKRRPARFGLMGWMPA